MGKFNSWLVDSLDFLNKVLAGIFIAAAVFKFWDALSAGFIGAVFETLIVIGVGVLTCGYIALMININNTLEDIRNRNNRMEGQ